MFEKTLRRCRADFGARILVERGSRHTLSQRAILEAMSPDPANRPVPTSHVAREVVSYDLADKIVVPSRHVIESFLEHGIPESRLFRNPYGVDLTLFPMTPPPGGKPTILMVGTWSRRKGADVLTEAWSTLPDHRLLHVGPIGDAPLPSGGDWVHHDPLDQRGLTNYYAQGHVFALASREEGLAVVLPQAAASGLSVVCTDRTGGADIAEMIGDAGNIVSVVPSGDAPSLARELGVQMSRQLAYRGSRDRMGSARVKLSWREYGIRYDQFLKRLVS
jgi:glycosyltransferase involved in cell wall biosynthesis